MTVPEPVWASLTPGRLEEARSYLTGVAQVTPLVTAGWLGEAADCAPLLKLENMQRTGAYKIRGALAFLGLLGAQGRRPRDVVTASAGNHGQAVALAAHLVGARATVVMPVGASLPKVAATKAFGADVVLEGTDVAESIARARELAAERGAVMVPPFDHLDIIAGQASVALEMFEAAPDLETLVVPVGGGGLISGMAVAARHHALRTGRPICVVGVQAAGADAFPSSLAAGRPTTVEIIETMADGISVSRPGDLTFACVRDLVDEIVTVTESELAHAVVSLLARSKQVVEPAGAAGVAALLAGRVPSAGRSGVVVSGGNIDQVMLEHLIRHGLTESERHHSFQVDLRDRPGEVARLVAVIAAEGANLVELTHGWAGPGTPPGMVSVSVRIETRGAEHGDAVLTSVGAAGYRYRT